MRALNESLCLIGGPVKGIVPCCSTLLPSLSASSQNQESANLIFNSSSLTISSINSTYYACCYNQHTRLRISTSSIPSSSDFIYITRATFHISIPHHPHIQTSHTSSHHILRLTSQTFQTSQTFLRHHSQSSDFAYITTSHFTYFFVVTNKYIYYILY